MRNNEEYRELMPPMIQPDRVFDLVKQFGPTLPSDLASRTGQNTMIIGAVLSTLVAEKRIKFTHAKWGSSPLYYTPEQSEFIQKIYLQLSVGERGAFDLLKSQLVLADSVQQTVMRASLRQLKDFAIPLTVTAPDEQEFLFWKWYLLPDEEAAAMIKKILLPQFEKEAVVAQESSAPISAPAQKASAPTPKQTAAQKRAAAKAQQQSLVDDDFLGSSLLAQKQKDAPKVSAQQAAQSSTIQSSNGKSSGSSDSTPLSQSILSLQPLPTNDDFFTLIHTKLAEKEVTVTSAVVVKKNSELDLHISLPTPFGHVTYYAKAKKKKKSSDSDIASAFAKGQMLHLPTAYISLGELTKKTNDMLKTDFIGVLVIRLSE